ncbi:hypothetical protein TNCT_78051 [Trichonephila clavata]|uniref:Uncharacterized protein n=1 Tax=Trichonephila clavata TaxID=2740835 RepID=A0A8X6GKH6_TRICU|nr:hypothetical protein TNCT_78051 [Trichonephila clavata]
MLLGKTTGIGNLDILGHISLHRSQVPSQTPRKFNSPKMHFQSNLPPKPCRFCECQRIQNAYHWAETCPFRLSAIQVPPQIPMQTNVDPPTEESQI